MAVYFAMQPDGLIKIGCSRHPERRILEQQLRLLGLAPGYFTEERAMHDRFAAHRVGITEQFRPAPELLDFIAWLPPLPPDYVEPPPRKADSLPVHMTFPRETFTKLKAEAERRGMGYSTLNAQIVFDWLESRRAKGEAA